VATRAWIVLIALLFGASSAWAQSAGPGQGPGQGRMGGARMGPGMMWGYGENWLSAIPNLTDEQREKIAAIEKEFRQKQWQLMEKMHELAVQSRVYRGRLDEQAARRNYDMIAALHKQMFENSLEEQKRIESILTPQQREQLQRFWGGQ
jgi:Spy/CpxP family protein refolding chaperone